LPRLKFPRKFSARHLHLLHIADRNTARSPLGAAFPCACTSGPAATPMRCTPCYGSQRSASGLRSATSTKSMIHPRPTKETPMSAFSERIRDQKNKGFYKVADLEGGKEVTHIIDHLLEAVQMFDKEVDVLNFQDTARQLQLNLTTSDFLINALGDDPETWGGKAVALFLDEYEYKGEKKLGIRLKLADATAAEASTKRALTRQADGKAAMNDDVPF
jgi:hypothetical protein